MVDRFVALEEIKLEFTETRKYVYIKIGICMIEFGTIHLFSQESLTEIRPTENLKQEAYRPLFAHMIKTAIAYLQMPCNFFQYCQSN